MIRDAALVAGANLDHLVQGPSMERVPRLVLLAGGLLATTAALALMHAVGGDIRGWLASGPTGLVTSLWQAFAEENAGARP
jgi:hypothetical protein